MQRIIGLIVRGMLLSTLFVSSAPAELFEKDQAIDHPAVWFDDYDAALAAGEAAGRMVCIWFYDPGQPAETDRFDREVLQVPQVAEVLARRFICVRLSTKARLVRNGQQVSVLEHEAFDELGRAPGVAIIDMIDHDSPLFRKVVSVYPFGQRQRPMTAEELAVMLALPRGTLTQRTLIFAVRTHPDRPASADSHYSPILARETQRHAHHQAAIRRQGHHHWESRFDSINAQLPSGLASREVCAESWPGQGLLEAARECVGSWRLSPGHWEAVSARHVLFGYDMQRGDNGVWYAAGIFAD